MGNNVNDNSSSNRKVKTFDMWDTLIKRYCHPEEVKLYTANNIIYNYNSYLTSDFDTAKKIYLRRIEIEAEICEENKNLGKDSECEIRKVLKKLLSEIFVDNSKVDVIVEELVADEIKREIEVTYINGDILKYLNEAKENDIDMYIISDFYMGKEDVSKILEHHDLLKYFKEIYVSCDVLKTKRNTGNLFTYFMEKEEIKPENIIHYGDSEHSDIEMAKLKNIEAVEIKNNSNYPFDIDNITADLRLRKVKREILNGKKKNKNDLKEYKDELYNLGIDLSPIAYFYIFDAIAEGRKKGYDNIFYQTREGETFIKYHNILEENNIMPFKIPSAELVHVSRVATFAPSLEKIDIANMLRLWSQYRNQSMDAMFVSLGMKTENYEKYLKRYDIDKNKKIQEPYFNYNVLRLFEDEEFLEEINRELDEKKKRIYKYFKNKGIKNEENDKMYIVDIGWRGTIQDNLAYLLNNTHIDGEYFTLFKFKNIQRKNTKKHAFISDLKFAYEYIDPVITILEMLFNSESGSVIGYDENGKEMRAEVKEESDYVKNVVSHIQAGMMHGARQINLRLEGRSFTQEQAENYVKDMIKNIKENPSKLLVEVYYGLVHNDTFGTGTYLKERDRLSALDKLRPFKVRRQIQESMWKESYYIENNLKIYPKLIKLKGKIRNVLGRNTKENNSNKYE